MYLPWMFQLFCLPRWSAAMTRKSPSHTLVHATVEAVLPCLGMAYLVDDDSREWTVSKSTAGADVASLKQGQRLQLDVEQHDTFSYVQRVCG
jgi:hypothetical protein